MENYPELMEQEQQITLQDYLRILYRGRWLILGSFVVMLLGAFYLNYSTEPEYQASAKILVENPSANKLALFNVDYLNMPSTFITNQVEILQSRTLAERVVAELESADFRDSLSIFQPTSRGDYLTLREQIDWILDHLTVTPKTESDIIEIVYVASTPFEAATVCNVIAESFQKLNRDFSRSELRELRRFLEFQLKKKSEELRQSEEALREYREREKLVSLDAVTSELISRLAEVQAELETAAIELEAAQEKKHNLEKQLEERRETLAVEVSQISSPLLQELQKEYARMVSEKVKYETLIAQDRTIDPQEYQMQLQSMSSRIKAVQDKLQEEAQRIANTSMVADPLQIAQKLIAEILDVETQMKALQAKVDALREVVDEYELELERLPGQGLELARLQRRVEVDQNTYILLTQKLEETKIADAGQKDIIRILDRAIEPLSPIKPKKKLNLLLGALLGIGLGVGLTFLLEFFDDSIKNPEELERMGFPILAIIPEISQEDVVSKKFSRNGQGQLSEEQILESRLVTHLDPKSPISEAYRTLRTNIQFKNLRQKENTLLVTSSAPKEGKSTTIANLAITMAQMGSRTLLVDTDLRRPVLHSLFNLKKDKGISNYLVGKLTFDEIVKSTFIDNLFIVTSGPLPPNPSEMLSLETMDEFIDRARREFDVVLFDSPPIIAVTDAAVLSTKVDGMLLVIRAHQTQRNAIKRAKNLLENVNAPIVGCVLNSVSIDRAYGSYYYYYYYHYYSYYGHDLKRRKKARA